MPLRLAIALSLSLSLPAAAAPPQAGPRVKVTTSMGAFTLELAPDAAPKTVENFRRRVREGFYGGTVFHRVTPDIVQGGGHLPDLAKKPYKDSVTNEADLAKSKGLTNRRGTIAMAYVPGDPYGAAVQFFINVRDNPKLDFRAKNLADYGFCPFGRVVQGMDVIDRISKAKTAKSKGFENVPAQAVTIVGAEEIPVASE
jgi:cyclophilin family peptidyl-prolyl cis-trans isomerase